MKGQILFCKKKHSNSIKSFSETDIIQMLVIFVMFDGHVLKKACCVLCSSFRRLVPLFIEDRLHTDASQEKRKESSAIL